MSKNKIIYGGAFLIVISIFVYSLQGSDSPEDYRNRIDKERDKQSRFMKYNGESPFVQKNIEFPGLKYYEPDLKYRVKARFEPIEKPSIRKLETSDNIVKEYLEYGTAYFKLDDKEQQLTILESVPEKTLFLAFGDATSADETYGAGRYLDVDHSGGRSILLDFNLAYNPYCAYSEGFSCPFPPKENLLDVAIKAGEKTFDH